MGSAILFFLPAQLLVLVLVGAALAAVFGLISPRVFWGLLAVIVLMLLLSPIIEALVAVLPLAWQLLILLVMAVVLGRLALGVLIGRGASDRFLAYVAYDMFTLPFRLLRLFLRWVFAGRRRDERAG